MLKDKDRFAISKTGEDPINPWFTKPRIQKILKEVERLRNVNRHNIKYNPKLMKIYVEKSIEHSEIMLHRYFAEYEELNSNLTAVSSGLKETETLPLYLKKEIYGSASKYRSPEANEYLLKYYQQLIKILPPAMAENLECAGNMYEVMIYDPKEGEAREIN
jgi:hypothetical protein